jgi:hypothetical protein
VVRIIGVSFTVYAQYNTPGGAFATGICQCRHHTQAVPFPVVGKRKQKIEIYYNCVGIIAVPDEDAWVAAILECKRGRKPKEQKTDNTKESKTA